MKEPQCLGKDVPGRGRARADALRREPSGLLTAQLGSSVLGAVGAGEWTQPGGRREGCGSWALPDI